jgi:hypothetical protein
MSILSFGDCLIVGASGYIRAVSKETGEEQWTANLKGKPTFEFFEKTKGRDIGWSRCKLSLVQYMLERQDVYFLWTLSLEVFCGRISFQDLGSWV